jgi:4-amino-4-deoxy-L-arabinose transferase-like glycosyltransferase
MNMQTDHTADYKSMAILTWTLIIGILLFCGVSIGLYYFGGISNNLQDYSQTVFLISLIATVVIIVATRAVYVRRVNVLKETNQSSKEKLEIFRSITITHMALCEFPALFSIISFMVFGNFMFFIVVAISLAEMIMKFPTQHKIESVIHSGTF